MVDLFSSYLLLVLFFPILGAIAVSVRLLLSKPVIFRQQRPGLHGIPFFLYKFRTMAVAFKKREELQSDEKRLKPFGSFLRKMSLDELPTLFNVLKGDMSLVGPRPLLLCYLDRYTPAQARRHEVRPGISGWAQVNGRNAITWEEKFKFDVWYLDHASLTLDIKILWMTLIKALKCEGISADGYATMPEFMGTEVNRDEH